MNKQLNPSREPRNCYVGQHPGIPDGVRAACVPAACQSLEEAADGFGPSPLRFRRIHASVAVRAEPIDIIGLEQTAMSHVRGLLSLLAFIVPATFHAQSRVGQPAPPLALTQVLQGERLLPRTGYPLLIEMWATWCQPCTAGIPHINALYQQFAERGVDFLWLSEDDESDKVAPFLKTHPMLGTVAIDGAGKRNLLFGQDGLPTTVLIDSTGHVAAITRSVELRAEDLEALVEHKPLSLAPAEVDYHMAETHGLFDDAAPADRDAADRSAADRNARVRLIIRRTNEPGGLSSGPEAWRTGGSRQDGDGGVSLQELLAKAYGVHTSQIIMPDYLNELYTVQAWVPSRTSDLFAPMMQAALAAAASVRIHHETRSMKVLVLRGLPGNLAKARFGGTVAGAWEVPPPLNTDEWSSISANDIRDQLQLFLPNEPVVLDRPIPGWFGFRCQYDPHQPRLLMDSLKSEGVTLHEETRPADVLVVEDAVPLRARP